VVVLPPPIAAEVLADAREQERQEEFIASRVALGDPLDGLHPLSDARRPDYEAWLAQQAPNDPQQAPLAPQLPSAPQSDAARWNIEPAMTGSMEHRAGEPDPSHNTAGAAGTGDAQ
jgi:hypothetical protein